MYECKLCGLSQTNIFVVEYSVQQPNFCIKKLSTVQENCLPEGYLVVDVISGRFIGDGSPGCAEAVR